MVRKLDSKKTYRHGNIAIAELLLMGRADSEAKTSFGDIMLLLAVREGKKI